MEMVQAQARLQIRHPRDKAHKQIKTMFARVSVKKFSDLKLNDTDTVLLLSEAVVQNVPDTFIQKQVTEAYNYMLEPDTIAMNIAEYAFQCGMMPFGVPGDATCLVAYVLKQ